MIIFQFLFFPYFPYNDLYYHDHFKLLGKKSIQYNKNKIKAHESAVRAMKWSHNDNWMVTADHKGIIKYWQSNMNNLKVIEGHKEAIRDLSCVQLRNLFYLFYLFFFYKSSHSIIYMNQ